MMVMEAQKTVTGSAHNVASWFLWGRVVRSKDYVIPLRYMLMFRFLLRVVVRTTDCGGMI